MIAIISVHVKLKRNLTPRFPVENIVLYYIEA